MTSNSATEIADAVRNGEMSALEIVTAVLKNIRDRSDLNCFTAISEQRALAEARAVDVRRARGEALPPLAGVPYAAKNLFDVRDMTTLAGSKLLSSDPPASADAGMIERMSDAGGVLVGTTNMDEFAFGFTTENTHYGPTRNPRDRTRMAGGSSGGSAAAVAAELVPLAFGSDTNGSVRVPASLCGVFALKPTYGRLTRRGVFPFVASLDHVGLFARSVGDLVAAYDAVQGADPADPVCSARASEPCSSLSTLGGRGLRIGRLTGYFDDNASPEAVATRDRALDVFDDVRDVTLPGLEEARAAAAIITAAEGAGVHLQDLIARSSEFDPLIRDRLLAGALIPATWVIRAQRFRRWFARGVAALFENFDVLVSPATPWAATPIGEREVELRGKNLNVQRGLGSMTMPFSLIGLPVAVAPGPVNGLPIGVQFISAPWREDLVLRAATAVGSIGVVS